jgi:hypothetical protein
MSGKGKPLTEGVSLWQHRSLEDDLVRERKKLTMTKQEVH